MERFDPATLALHYQPILDLRTGQVIAAEALLRDGHTDASAGIADAENGSAIFELDRWILRNACREAAEWRAAGLEQTAVHVNVSAREMERRDLPAMIDEAIASSGLPPAALQIEITETRAIEDLKLASRRLESREGRGVGIWLDDFGTGHSSLAWLKDFYVDGVKLPYDLIHGVTESARCASIVRHVIELAHEIDTKVIAEGVEEESEVDFLRKCGCDALQGYYFATPVSARELLAEVGRRRTGRE
jgi:EAL domain-containing protein (putative c-di-GMP-specific phosphodiesterase class I)